MPNAHVIYTFSFETIALGKPRNHEIYTYYDFGKLKIPDKIKRLNFKIDVLAQMTLRS